MKSNASGGKKPINLGIEAEAMLQGKFFSKIDKIIYCTHAIISCGLEIFQLFG